MWVGGVIMDFFCRVFLWQSEQSQHGFFRHYTATSLPAHDRNSTDAERVGDLRLCASRLSLNLVEI